MQGSGAKCAGGIHDSIVPVPGPCSRPLFPGLPRTILAYLLPFAKGQGERRPAVAIAPNGLSISWKASMSGSGTPRLPGSLGLRAE